MTHFLFLGLVWLHQNIDERNIDQTLSAIFMTVVTLKKVGKKGGLGPFHTAF